MQYKTASVVQLSLNPLFYSEPSRTVRRGYRALFKASITNFTLPTKPALTVIDYLFFIPYPYSKNFLI